MDYGARTVFVRDETRAPAAPLVAHAAGAALERRAGSPAGFHGGGCELSVRLTHDMKMAHGFE